MMISNYDRDDQDNYDPVDDNVDDNDMMINIHVMNIIFMNTWAAQAGMSNRKVFIKDDDNAYDYVDDGWWWWLYVIHIFMIMSMMGDDDGYM